MKGEQQRTRYEVLCNTTRRNDEVINKEAENVIGEN